MLATRAVFLRRRRSFFLLTSPLFGDRPRHRHPGAQFVGRRAVLAKTQDSVNCFSALAFGAGTSRISGVDIGFLARFREIYQRLYRLLQYWRFELLCLLGRVVLLAPAATGPAHKTRSGPAPSADAEGGPFHNVDHPVLRELRDRAIEDIFEWLGIDGVPPQLWNILNEEPDPAEATIRFIRSVGCDPITVRRREPSEIRRLNRAVDALLAWSRMSSSAHPTGMRRLQALLFWATPDEIARFQQNTDALATIVGSYESLPGSRRLVRHQLLVRRLERFRLDPLGWSSDERKTALRESAQLEAATLRYSVVANEIERLMEELEPLVGGLSDSDDDVGLLRAARLRRQEVERDLFSTGASEPAALVASIEGIVVLLKNAAEHLREATASGSDSGGFDASAAAHEEEQRRIKGALCFFDFDPRTPPSYEIAKKAHKKKQKENHPDRFAGRGKDVFDRQTAIFQEIEQQWCILDAWYGRP